VSEEPIAAEPAYLTHRQILTVLGALMLGMLLAALDQTIVNRDGITRPGTGMIRPSSLPVGRPSHLIIDPERRRCE
jgi:hypothetical protein